MIHYQSIACRTALFLVCTVVWQPVGLAAQPAEISFQRVTIDKRPPDKPYCKIVADISGDGFPDIVVAGDQGPVVLYTYPNWRKTRLASPPWNGVRGAAGDIDRDGDLDIVLGGVLWLRNPGSQGGSWDMIRIDKQKAHDVQLGDLDLDGHLDIVARDQSAFGGSGNTIFLYRQERPDSWRRHTNVCPHGEGLALGDLDSDGDLDILIGARWYENLRGAGASRWTEHRYTTAWTEPDVKVEMADINGDRRPDIVLTPAELKGQTYKVAWYEAPRDPKKSDWTEHIIVPSIECVIHSLGTGDFDGDGDIDIAIAEMHQGRDPDEVSVLINRGAGNAWQQQILSTNGSHDIIVADIDADHDPDIVGANHAGNCPLELWRNETHRSEK